MGKMGEVHNSNDLMYKIIWSCSYYIVE